MIEIRVYPKGDGMVLSAEGHAGMAPRGRDIVCAGVSALLYGFAAYLESLAPRGMGCGSGGAAAHRGKLSRLRTTLGRVFVRATT